MRTGTLLTLRYIQKFKKYSVHGKPLSICWVSITCLFNLICLGDYPMEVPGFEAT